MAAGALQKAELISYTRGSVSILDRKVWKTQPLIAMSLSSSNQRTGQLKH
jgi:hypothetical protein